MEELRNGWIHNSMRGSWKWCPRSFKLRYIDGEPSPETSVLLMGNLFHDFSSFYHKEIKMEEFECFSLLSDLIEWQLLIIPEERAAETADDPRFLGTQTTPAQKMPDLSYPV